MKKTTNIHVSDHDIDHLKRMFPENGTMYTVVRHRTQSRSKIGMISFALDTVWHPTVLVALVCKLKVTSWQGQDVIVVDRYANAGREIAEKLGLALYGRENAIKHESI